MGLGGDRQFDEFPRPELFGRRFVSKFQFSHLSFLLLHEGRDPLRPASSTSSVMAPATHLKKVTDSVHLAHGEAVNWALVTDDTGVMLIDAGYPGDRDDVLASLRKLGYAADDVRAILLTHAHVDHLGSAIWFAREHGTPVYCHADEVGHAKREYLQQVSVVDVALRLWRPRWALWAAHVARNGGLVRDGIPTIQPLTAEIAGSCRATRWPFPLRGTPAGIARILSTGCWLAATR